MRVEYITFRSRVERSEYVARRFKSLLNGKVLDVRCDLNGMK